MKKNYVEINEMVEEEEKELVKIKEFWMKHGKYDGGTYDAVRDARKNNFLGASVAAMSMLYRDMFEKVNSPAEIKLINLKKEIEDLLGELITDESYYQDCITEAKTSGSKITEGYMNGKKDMARKYQDKVRGMMINL